MNDDKLREMLANRVKSKWTYRIPVDYSDIPQVVEWCEKNCQGPWFLYPEYCYVHLDDDRDATLYFLKWQSK